MVELPFFPAGRDTGEILVLHVLILETVPTVYTVMLDTKNKCLIEFMQDGVRAKAHRTHGLKSTDEYALNGNDRFTITSDVRNMVTDAINSTHPVVMEARK